MKTQAQQQMTQMRRHASALLSLVAGGTSTHDAAGKHGVDGIEVTRCIRSVTGSLARVARVSSGSLNKGHTSRLSNGVGTKNLISGFNWKHRNIIRGGNPPVAGG